MFALMCLLCFGRVLAELALSFTECERLKRSAEEDGHDWRAACVFCTPICSVQSAFKESVKSFKGVLRRYRRRKEGFDCVLSLYLPGHADLGVDD
eukprot:1147948-Pelagomonas_calceolata.AAC.1